MSAVLMDSEIHEVQEVWARWKDLQATHHVAKGSPKDICFSGWCILPNCLRSWDWGESNPPKLLCRHVGLTFCPWCGKEGQNEGTVANHLQTIHYHLGLICSQCLKYFTTSADTMHHHSQLCKQALADVNDDDNQVKESNSDDKWQGQLSIQLKLAPPHWAIGRQSMPYLIVLAPPHQAIGRCSVSCPVVHTRTSTSALLLNTVGCIAPQVMNSTIQYSLSIVDHIISKVLYLTQ